MLPNAFIGKPDAPTGEDLAAELGPTKTLWDQLVTDLVDEFHIDTKEWHSYSQKAGWSLRLKQKKRTILYLIPRHGSFRVAFILGDKAVQAAHATRLPQRIITAIDEAPRYPEGTGVRLDVAGPKDLPVVRKLAAIKIAN